MTKKGHSGKGKESEELMDGFLSRLSVLEESGMDSLGAFQESLKIIHLYHGACKNWMSLSLWTEFVEYVAELLESLEITWETASNFLDEASRSLGRHYVYSSAFWKMYAHLAKTYDPQLLLEIYPSAVSSPSLHLPELIEDSEAFSEVILDQEQRAMFLNRVYELSLSSSKFTEDVKIYENEIENLTHYMTKDNEKKLVKSWCNYFQYLHSKKYDSQDSATLDTCCVIFERGVRDLYGIESIWRSYLVFLSEVCWNIRGLEYDVKDVISYYIDTRLKVCSRAVNLCSTSLNIWRLYISAIEEYNMLLKKNECEELDHVPNMLNVLDECVRLNPNSNVKDIEFLLHVLVSICYYYIRQKPIDKVGIRTVLDRCYGFIDIYQNTLNGQSKYRIVAFKLIRLCTELEVGVFDSISTARYHWNSIIKREASYRDLWIQFIEFEKTYGDYKSVHKLYERMIGALKADVKKELIRLSYEEYITFEEQYGTAQSISQLFATLESYNIRDLANSEKRISKRSSQTQVDNKHSKKPKQEDTKEFNSKLIVKNVPFKASNEEIQDVFSKYGEIIKYEEHVTKKGLKTGIVYVTFDNEVSARHALDLHETMVLGRSIQVYPFKGQSKTQLGKLTKWNEQNETYLKRVSEYGKVEENTVFVINLPSNKTTFDVKKHFRKFGKIIGVRFPKKHGLAYVEFEEKEAADQCVVEFNGSMYEGRKLNVSISKPPERKESKFVDDKLIQPKTIFVKNIPTESNTDDVEHDLRELFTKAGTIKDIRLSHTRGGLFKGYAFIDFEDEASASNALNYNQSKLGDKSIVVDRALINGKTTQRQLTMNRKVRYSRKPKLDVSTHDSNSKGLSNEDFRSMLL